MNLPEIFYEEYEFGYLDARSVTQEIGDWSIDVVNTNTVYLYNKNRNICLTISNDNRLTVYIEESDTGHYIYNLFANVCKNIEEFVISNLADHTTDEYLYIFNSIANYIDRIFDGINSCKIIGCNKRAE
jgi:hypothetical protein